MGATKNKSKEKQSHKVLVWSAIVPKCTMIYCPEDGAFCLAYLLPLLQTEQQMGINEKTASSHPAIFSRFYCMAYWWKSHILWMHDLVCGILFCSSNWKLFCNISGTTMLSQVLNALHYGRCSPTFLPIKFTPTETLPLYAEHQLSPKRPPSYSEQCAYCSLVLKGLCIVLCLLNTVNTASGR